MENELSFQYLKDELDKIIVDLDYQKEQLIAIYLKHYGQSRNYQKGDRRVIPLLIGPSGSGKTALVQALAKITKRDFYCIDASNTAANGYKGQDLSEKLGMFFSQLERNEKRFSNSIIFIDEFDKLVTNTYKHQSNSITDQQQFLSFFDSNEFSVSYDRAGYNVNTSNVLIILAGAFSELYDVMHHEEQGFGFVKKTEYEQNQQEETVDLIHRLERFGLIPEIVGRIGMMISFPKPNHALIKRIMASETGVINQWKRYFHENYSVGLAINDDARNYIVKNVMNVSLGIRAINHFIQPIMNELLIQVEKDETINKVKVKYDLQKGLYTEYVFGNSRKKRDTYSFVKEKCPSNIRGLKRINHRYLCSREEIEDLVEMYTDNFSKECKFISYKFLKKIACLYRSVLLYMATEVITSEMNVDSFLKLLDIGIKIDRSFRTTYDVLIYRECGINNEYRKEIFDNYEEYTSMPHFMCTEEVKDSILIAVMEMPLEGEKK